MALGEQQREVVQARVPARRPRAGLLAEDEEILAAGAERARAIAVDTMRDVRSAMGVGPRG